MKYMICLLLLTGCAHKPTTTTGPNFAQVKANQGRILENNERAIKNSDAIGRHLDRSDHKAQILLDL